MEKKMAAFFAGLVFIFCCYGQQLINVDPVLVRPDSLWEKGFQNRLNKFLYKEVYKVSLYDANSDQDAGKRAWPPLLAELYKAKDNPGKVNNLIHTIGDSLIHSKWAGNFYKPFTMPGYSMYYFQYKDRLPASQLAYTRKHLYDKGWEYLMRNDGYMDPIYLPPNFPQGTEFNSENFNWMARMSGYLFAHEFNDTEKIKYFDNYIRNWIRALYNAGRVEWNSNNYWSHVFNPLLSLHTNVKDPEVKKMANAGLDWLVTEAALHYLDGFFAAGDVRAKAGSYKPFAGSVWGYNYLYFTDSLHMPSYKEDFSDKELKDFIGFAPYSNYRPARVLIDIAQRKFKLPVEVHSAKPFYHLDNDNYADWKGNTARSRKFEFETNYMDENYALVSLASNRPDGRIGTYSEESLWRLSVKGIDNGSRQVIGNSGEMSTMAGRWPYEEIAQYRNVMIRLVKNTDNIWIAMPKEIATEYVNNKLFADMGNGVYTVYIPYNCTEINDSAFKYDSTYHTYTWKFEKGKLGALALEVGTLKQFGSYAQFKQQVIKNSTIKSKGADILNYRSTSGNELKVKYMPFTTYKLYIPLAKDNPPHHKGVQEVNPAGVTAKVWGNGKLIEYQKWNAYEVDFGDKIVHQRWGSGIMTLQAGGSGLKISVNPVNGHVSYHTFASEIK
ncbi:MAG: hypothetical protein H7Y86_13655 [Rhizobacter sp.]|nr:hypothetical protein [Ferruginibacter sp.]